MPKVSTAHEQQQRQRILQAASTCFGRGGYHETSVQDICDEAGISKGGLYTYFKSKEEILAAVIEDSFLTSLEQAKVAAAGAGTVVEHLDRVAAVVIDRVLADGAQSASSPMMLLEIWAEASKNNALRTLCVHGYEEWQAFLAGLLRAGVERGELTSDVDPEALAAVLVAMFDGLMLQESITRTQVDWRRVTGALRASLTEGVLSPGARAARE